MDYCNLGYYNKLK
ncbi:uncharacterized protein FFFS_04597 [Fusarium fujikuroi]|nr:uncharacterized protein FFFS_04597 [Fusarium fujikuroi]